MNPDPENIFQILRRIRIWQIILDPTGTGNRNTAETYYTNVSYLVRTSPDRSKDLVMSPELLHLRNTSGLYTGTGSGFDPQILSTHTRKNVEGICLLYF